MARAKTSKATQPESKVAFTRAEINELAASMTPEDKAEIIKAMAPEDRLALLGEVTTKEERKSLNAKETARVAREKREKEERELQASIEAEKRAYENASLEELATMTPNHLKTLVKISTMTWDFDSQDWVAREWWDFGKSRASRSGAPINKREIDPERVIFQSGTRLVLGNSDYVYASKVCESLGITWKPDSAARVLCNAAITDPTGKTSGVKVRMTTPAGTTETTLAEYVKLERVVKALETRE